MSKSSTLYMSKYSMLYNVGEASKPGEDAGVKEYFLFRKAEDSDVVEVRVNRFVPLPTELTRATTPAIHVDGISLAEHLKALKKASKGLSGVTIGSYIGYYPFDDGDADGNEDMVSYLVVTGWTAKLDKMHRKALKRELENGRDFF